MRDVREDQHGTTTGYVYGCRCDLCRDAGRAYHRTYDARHCAERVDAYAERTVQSVAWFDERVEISDRTATGRLTDFNLDNMLYQADRPRQYAAGRRCCHDGCKTILSRYNAGTTCDPHKATPDFSDFTDRIIFGEKLCPTCDVPKPRNTEHFSPDVENNDGLHRECKECRNAGQRDHRKAHADYERIRYQTDPEFRERRKTTSRENKARRYATDPAFRERCKASARASKARCKARGNS